MAALLRHSFYRLGAIASRQKPLVAFYNLQNGPGLRGFVQSQCFQKRGKFSNQARCSYTFLKIFKVATKRVFPLVQKNHIHSSCVVQQQTVTKKEEIGSPHWKMFRYISVIMIGVYPAAVLAPTPVIDWAITVFFPLHSYWGTKEILSDYLPEIFSNKAITTTAVYLWTGVSALTFLGLAYLNIYDVGVCKAVAMLWKL